MSIRFDGQVAIVTGAGAGLGRVYALELARRGAKVVVNDLGTSTDGKTTGGSGTRPADAVCAEIRAAGGTAEPNYDSVVDGEKLVATALAAFGRIDIIVNNAGILRDMGFHRMSKKDFNIVHAVHILGAKNTIQAAWPHMRKQKYGRIVNVTSVNGLYGQRGQVNYSSAKAGVVGLTKALAKEGKKYNIKVNVVAPGAGSRMTATVMPKAMVDMWKPEFVAPMISLLAHNDVPCSGSVFEAGGGFFAEVKFTRAGGAFLDIDQPLDAEKLKANWSDVTSYTNATDPELEHAAGLPGPQLKQIMDKMSKL